MSSFSEDMKRDPAMLSVILVSLFFGITLAYDLGNDPPHNHIFRGRVVGERVVYGNLISGYSVDHPGIVGKIERIAADLARPGAEMRVYELEVTEVSYDVLSWFVRERCQTPMAARVHFQAEGDVADVGDSFTSMDLGRASKTFALRGIRGYEGGPIMKNIQGLRFFRAE